MSDLGDPRFRRLLLGGAVSSFGDTALYLSLAIWAKDLTGSNGAAGAIFLALGLPYLTAPLTGHWVDRVPRRPLLIALNAATGVVVLSLLAVQSEAEVWLLYAVSAFYGATLTIQGSAMNGLLKDFITDRQLASANAAFATVGQGVRIISPLVGAALFEKLGGGSVAVLDAASFAFAVALLASVRVRESPIARCERVGLGERLLAGVRYVRRTPILRQMVRSAVFAMLVLGFYESLTFAVIAALGKRPSFLGVLMSVQGLGSIAGGLLAGRVTRKVGEPRTLGLALAMWALASLVYTIQNLTVALIALALFGIAVPLYEVAVNTASQRFTPPRMQGRVGSTVMMSTNLSQTFSIAIGAVLVGAIDYRLLLLIVAVVASAAAAPVLMRPESRQPTDISDEPPNDPTQSPKASPRDL